MKFFIAFALIAVAAAGPITKSAQLSGEAAEIAQIVAAIQSPSTDPATAAALEQMLLDTLGLSPVSVGPAIVETSPISVGPAIVETNPISVGAAMIDFPLPDGGVVTAEEPTVVAAPAIVEPVIIGELPAGSAAPLVQIILNINQAADSVVVPVSPAVVDNVVEPHVPGAVNVVDNVVAPSPAPVIIPSPVVVPAPVVVDQVAAPGPVNVVDGISVEPIQVVSPVIVEPIQVVDQVAAPGPVNVVDGISVEPIQVVSPIIVDPVVVGTPIIPAPAVVLPEILN